MRRGGEFENCVTRFKTQAEWNFKLCSSHTETGESLKNGSICYWLPTIYHWIYVVSVRQEIIIGFDGFSRTIEPFFCRRRCHRRHHRRQPVYWQKAQRHHQQIIALSHIHMFAQSNCQPVKVNFRFQFLRFSQIQTNFFPSIRFRNLCRVKIDKKL